MLFCLSTNPPAQAQFIAQIPAQCWDASEARVLLERSGEITSSGLMGDQLSVQVRSKSDGAYVIAFVLQNGRTCFVAVGTDWSTAGDNL